MLVSIGSRYATTSPRTSKGRPTPARLLAPLRTTPLHDALLAVHPDDAHCYLYHEPGERGVTRHTSERPHPRFEALRIDTLFCDLDNADHAAWPDDQTGIAAALQARDVAQTAGVYVTTRGMRLVQPLERALPVLEADAAMRAWYAELERRGLRVDHSTAQWTRSFRLPHVVREGHGAYRSPLVDLSRMRPVPAPAGGYVRRARERGGPLVDVGELADLPATWAETARALLPIIAGEPWGVADGWHKLALRLTGAALQRGLRPEYAVAFALAAMPEQMPRQDAAQAARDTARRYASRRAVQGLRALEDAHPRVADVLVGRMRPCAAAAARAPSLPPAAESSAALLEDLRQVRPGLRLIAAACGVGKTRGARLLAAERAAAGERTVISVPTHELAHQVVADLRAAGVEARRLFGPLSVRRDDGSPACQFHVPASRLAEGRQSVQALLCDTCEHRDGCPAYETADGPRDAPVVVGPHAMLRSLVALAGADDLLILDEPPPLTEQLVLRREHLLEIDSYEERFEPAYFRAVRPAVELVDWWLRLEGLSVSSFGRPGQVYHLSAALELDPQRTEAVRAALGEAVVGHEPPALRSGAARQCKWDHRLAGTLGRLSRTLDVVRRAVLSLEARARIETVRGDTEHRQLALTLLREDLALALRRDGPTVVAAADVELHADAYRAVSSTSAPVTAYAASDGAPVSRVQLALRATRTHWLPAPSKLDGPAYEALQLALVWLREQPFERAAIVTYLELEQRLRGAWAELLPAGVEVGHYGALRGLDRWRDVDAIITLGDPRPPVDQVERELLLLGQHAGEDAIRTRCDALAAAELEQAHGRLRAPHRTRPARALHVGQVTPAGWVGHTTVQAPREGVITPDEVRRTVEDLGGPRAVGRLLGTSHVTVVRWSSGERRCPPDVAEWLRSRSAPSPGSYPVDGSVKDAGTAPHVNIYIMGGGTSLDMGGGTSDPGHGETSSEVGP